MGQLVSKTNYDRVTWAVIGLCLIYEYPLGYGLVERSFYCITKTKWPDSLLDQSHTGWIDPTLGIGVPGIILVYAPIKLVIYRFMRSINFDSVIANRHSWGLMTIFVLCSLLFLWTTTEVSLKVNLIALIFCISFAIGISYKTHAKS